MYYKRPNRSMTKNVEFYKQKMKRLEQENLQLKEEVRKLGQEVKTINAKKVRVEQVIKQKTQNIKTLKISNKKLHSQIKYLAAKIKMEPSTMSIIDGFIDRLDEEEWTKKGLKTSIRHLLDEFDGRKIEGYNSVQDLIITYITEYSAAEFFEIYDSQYFDSAVGYDDGVNDRWDRKVYVFDTSAAQSLIDNMISDINEKRHNINQLDRLSVE